MIIRTILEIAAVALLIYGFINEERVIDFEMEVRRIVVGNIRHAIRTHKHKKAVKNGNHLYLHSVKDDIRNSSNSVA